jgi:DNA adenine methylase
MLPGMRSTLASLRLPKDPPSPAVKWVGGKDGLADQIIPLLPRDVRGRRWHEPFVGGGAMFFRILPGTAFLSDACADLVMLYEVLRAGPIESFWWHLTKTELLHTTANGRAQYELVRDLFNRGEHGSPEQRAAWFLYLNRAGFNGLHRVNSKGEFNVPFGDVKRVRFDRGNLAHCGQELRRAELFTGGFASVLDRAAPGDVVYLDPPYLGTFSGYSGDFGPEQHVELSRVFRALDERGCIVVLSTSDEPLIRELYQGFEATVVSAGRAVGARASTRGKVDELVIRGHTR